MTTHAELLSVLQDLIELAHEHDDTLWFKAQQAHTAIARRLEAWERDAKDAARWRALIAGRVRVLGSAGLHSELNPYGEPWDGYAHIGVELWTKHPPSEGNAESIADLTTYADKAAALTQAQAGGCDARV